MALPDLPTLACVRRDLGPVLAEIGAPGWREVQPVTFLDCESGRAPLQGTELRVARTAEALRVVFDCLDANPWATMAQRDDPLYREETVECFLDPVGDSECYFEIELNPLNTVLDLVVRKSVSGLKKDFRWQCDGLATAVRRTERGWAAELSIPFESLLPGAAAIPAWRCNFTRIDREAAGADPELTAWSPTGLRQFHVPNRMGYLLMV